MRFTLAWASTPPGTGRRVVAWGKPGRDARRAEGWIGTMCEGWRGRIWVPQRRAVLIGVSSYEHLPTLPMVADQVEGLRAVLAEPDSGGYEVTTAIDQPLSYLRSAFEDSLGSSRTGDTLILYFSGHGLVSDSAELYLAGTDVNPENVQQTAYPAQKLGEFLDGSAASTVVVLLDCCYAGRMMTPVSALAAAAGPDARTSGDAYRRRSIITSSTDLELAHYDDTEVISAK